ncbi:MbnP family protein [Mesonia mobilis]|uniref:MbnP family protein n=1 Tax=Mesonia mobilis TaxID=369791 RepID=UPI0026EA4FDF|nr:MbnP family protein [Mesonia mobilis]
MKKWWLLFVVLGFVACLEDSDDQASPQEFTEVTLQFQNQIEGENVVLNSETYVNSEETYEIETLRYIISNIVLIAENGEEFAYPQAESYFVVNEENEASKSITLEGIPMQNYEAIRFGLGVDQSNYPLNGVNNFVPTAEENNMLWSWSAGYIFLRFEGNYTSATENDHLFAYHIGSHGQALDNYKEVTLDFQNTLALDSSNSIEITSDVSKIFEAEFSLSLEDIDDIQVDPQYSPQVMANFSQSFSIQQ